MSVDGTYFRISKEGQALYRHKFKKSGLRYEVAIYIMTGDIVWYNGTYEYSICSDIKR